LGLRSRPHGFDSLEAALRAIMAAAGAGAQDECDVLTTEPTVAYWPKADIGAPHMSAFEGKTDMAFCESPLSRSLLG
jgi:hypothetical protein